MNELKSYTEYAVSTPTADFVIGFDFNYGEDAVNVTVDNVPATTAGYTVVYLNETTIRLSPSVPSGVVRLQRETDIDQTDHAYRAGAKFIAQTMDENFEQLRHSQQEVRDGFVKLADDTYEIIDTLEEVAQSAQDAADDANAAAQVANAAAAQVADKVSQFELSAALQPITQDLTTVKRYTPLPYIVGKVYEVGERVTLSIGEIVENLVPNNAVNPNSDMTGWVKTNSASQIFDKSGKSQQQINDITAAKVKSVLDYGAVQSIDIASDAAYAAAISDMADGDTLEIGFGTFVENNVLINKEINIIQKGSLWLHGDNGNAIKFIQEPSFIFPGTALITLPKAGDSSLNLPPPAGVNLADYCFTLESTEVITNRLGFTDPYTKNEFGYFLTSDGYLASSINIDYLDASKLTIKLYKKQRTREVRNLLPSIKPNTFTGSNRVALVQESGVNNITYENCGIDKSNAESLGEGWAINRSGMNTYNSPIAIKTNKLGGDAYPFIGFIHGHNTFNNPKVILAANNHRGRFFASRHGSEIVFNGLVGSIDEHWGYKYSINDSTIYAEGVITFAGGTLKLNNVNRYAKNSQDGLVTLRADTPTAHGDLIFDSCNVVGSLFYASRLSIDPTVGVHRKSFDRIIIRDSSVEDHGYQAISLRGYDPSTFINDTREQTELIVNDVSYSRIADAGVQYGFVNNQIQAGWNVFSKVTLNNVVPSVIGLDTVTTPYYLLRYLQTDVLDVINCPDFTAQGLVLVRGKVIGGSVGTAQGGLSSVKIDKKLDYIGTTLNSDFLNHDGIQGADTVGYIGCTINTDKIFNNTAVISNMFGNVYGNNISATLYSQIIDITNYTHPNRRKQLYSSVTLSSPLTINAGTRSAVRLANTVGARLGDFPFVSVAYAADISISAWISANNNTSYVLENKTSNPITLPVGTVINVWVKKP